MILLHKLQQISERTTASLDVSFGESAILADNNQCTFLLHNFAAIIGRRGGYTMK